jgi:hypothetical protein
VRRRVRPTSIRAYRREKGEETIREIAAVMGWRVDALTHNYADAIKTGWM